jgi:hypothetical protein
MTTSQVERSGCRFKAIHGADGKPIIRMELFHNTVSLAGVTLDFELLAGTTLAEAHRLADAASERILNVVITPA